MLGGEQVLPLDEQQDTAVHVCSTVWRAEPGGGRIREEGELGGWIPEVGALLDGESWKIG